MKVLVTGGAGTIGSHAVRALQRAGRQPVVLGNLVHGHRAIVEQVLPVPFVGANLADRQARGGAPLPIMLSSTAATYGIPSADLITEQHPTNPINPYGTSKHTVEAMLADYGRAYSLASVIFRYFNAAGADPGLIIGKGWGCHQRRCQ